MFGRRRRGETANGPGPTAQDPDPFTMKRLNADVTLIPFEESRTYSEVGQQAKDAGAFDV